MTNNWGIAPPKPEMPKPAAQPGSPATYTNKTFPKAQWVHTKLPGILIAWEHREGFTHPFRILRVGIAKDQYSSYQVAHVLRSFKTYESAQTAWYHALEYGTEIDRAHAAQAAAFRRWEKRKANANVDHSRVADKDQKRD